MRKLLFYIILIVFSGIFYLAWKDRDLPPILQKFMSNYGLHFLGTFAYTLAIGLVGGLNTKTYMRTMSYILTASVLISTTGELTQYFDPRRVVDKYDVLMQVAGCLMAYAILIKTGPVKFEILQNIKTE